MNLRYLKAAYLTSPHFGDIYLNLTQNKAPLGKGAAKRLEQNARNYMILDGLLFKIIEVDDGRLDTVLCISTSKVHILLDTYHSSLTGEHSGLAKCYQTISQHQSHWCFLFLSNLFNSLKIRHIVHTQHCKYVHIKYIQTLMLMTLMLTMHNGTSMIKMCKTYIYLSQKLVKWHYLMYISIQRTICPQIN